MTAYLLAISLAGGLGAFALAADWYRRSLARRGGRVLDAYTAALLLALLPGVVALGAGPVVGTARPGWLVLAVPAGLAGGAATRWCDRAIIRAIARRPSRTGDQAAARTAGRRSARSAGRPARGGRVASGAWGAGGARGGGRSPSRVAALAGSADGPVRLGPVTPTAGALLLGGGARREPPAPPGTTGTLDPRQFPLGTVLAVAVAEEAFYRGVLLRAALLPPGWVGPALAVATVAAFALAHVTFGWPHVLAKAPLGAVAAAAALAFGSVLPALVAHLWFNFSVWRDLRAAPR